MRDLRDRDYTRLLDYIKYRKVLGELILALLVLLVLCCLVVVWSAHGQAGPEPLQNWIVKPLQVRDPVLLARLPDTPLPRFYTKRAKWELGIELAAAGTDMGQTCHNLSTGGHEQNLPTQSCAGAVALTAGFIAAGEGLAYFLHRRGHHQLEHLPRFYLIYGSTRGMVYSKNHGAW